MLNIGRSGHDSEWSSLCHDPFNISVCRDRSSILFSSSRSRLEELREEAVRVEGKSPSFRPQNHWSARIEVVIALQELEGKKRQPIRNCLDKESCSKQGELQSITLRIAFFSDRREERILLFGTSFSSRMKSVHLVRSSNRLNL